MKTDFMIALTQLAAERNMPRDVILKTIETALVSIFKKSSFTTEQEITVEIVPQTGQVKVYTQKKVLAKPTNLEEEISLSEAKKIRKDILSRKGQLAYPTVIIDDKILLTGPSREELQEALEL